MSVIYSSDEGIELKPQLQYLFTVEVWRNLFDDKF